MQKWGLVLLCFLRGGPLPDGLCRWLWFLLPEAVSRFVREWYGWTGQMLGARWFDLSNLWFDLKKCDEG